MPFRVDYKNESRGEILVKKDGMNTRLTPRKSVDRAARQKLIVEVLNPLQKILNEAQVNSEWYKYYENDLERKKQSKMCGKTLESYLANRK